MGGPDERSQVLSLPRDRADVLPLLAQVHSRLVDGLAGVAGGPCAAWGPDHADSPDPAAAALREHGVGFAWTLVAFPGWSLWDLHVGVVPHGEDVLAVGLHWHDSLQPSIPTAAVGPAAAAIGTTFHPLSGEHHADLLVLAWRTFTPGRAAQVLSDAALDLALSLHAPLAHELTQPHPTPRRSPSHD